jgi:hypothetical protein
MPWIGPMALDKIHMGSLHPWIEHRRKQGFSAGTINHGLQIVRGIFAEYLSGKSPRKIAADLNSEDVPPPRGKSWNASTINGDRQRGYGIHHNEIYGGRLVWNRVRMT